MGMRNDVQVRAVHLAHPLADKNACRELVMA
jgi:hypothetical protein